MTKLAALALFHRDGLSHGSARRALAHEAYHWGIIIMPQNSEGRDCHVFEATDATEIDPVTFRLNNPTMDWWFRAKLSINPEVSTKLIGCFVVGQVPDGVSTNELRDFFERVPLPVKNTNPQQSCVTWAVDAVQHMQRTGWVSSFDLDQLKDVVLSYADERMRGQRSTEPKVKYYGIGN